MTAHRRALVLVGGINHGREQAADHVIALLANAGYRCEVVEDPAALAGLDHDLLTVAALWWRMLPERYEAVRDEWARELPEPARKAIERHVGLGRPLLGCHTASISFDDWPRWGEILGGSWNWDRSSHPPLDSDNPVHVSIRSASELTRGLDDFDVIDEVYGFLDLAPDIEVLATSPHGGVDHPVWWTHTLPSGSRVVYVALGHDERSVGHLAHEEMLRRSVAWLGEELDP